MRAAPRGGGLVCNIGTGRETSVNGLLDEMAAQAGVEPVRTHKPLRAGELVRSSLDASRAAIHLGWSPWTELGAGTAATIGSVRRRLEESGDL